MHNKKFTLSSDLITASLVIICSLILFIFLWGLLTGFYITKSKRIYIYMPNAYGLQRNSEVRYSGAKVGIVRRLRFARQKEIDEIRKKEPLARFIAEINVNPDIPIPSTVHATVQSLNILGEKYLSLSDSQEDFPNLENLNLLQDGQVIPLAQNESDFESAEIKIAVSTVLEGLGIGENQKKQIQAMITSLATQFTMPENHPGNSPELRSITSLNEIFSSLKIQLSLDEKSPYAEPNNNLAVHINAIADNLSAQLQPHVNLQEGQEPTLMMSLKKGLSHISSVSQHIQTILEQSSPSETATNIKLVVANANKISQNLAAVSEELKKFSSPSSNVKPDSPALSKRLETLSNQIENLSNDLRVTVQIIGYFAEELRKRPHSLIFGGKPTPPTREEISEQISND